MNIKPLIDALELLDAAAQVTPDPTERLAIKETALQVAQLLQKRGVFTGRPKPDNEDAQAILRALADDNTRDPIGDMAQEIVEELQREICQRGTEWHNIGLAALVEDIIRENMPRPKDPDQGQPDPT